MSDVCKMIHLSICNYYIIGSKISKERERDRQTDRQTKRKRENVSANMLKLKLGI